MLNWAGLKLVITSCVTTLHAAGQPLTRTTLAMLAPEVPTAEWARALGVLIDRGIVAPRADQTLVLTDKGHAMAVDIRRAL